MVALMWIPFGTGLGAWLTDGLWPGADSKRVADRHALNYVFETVKSDP